MHFMKKIFLLLAAACVTLSAAADEGMWMLMYILHLWLYMSAIRAHG